jgi:hypothetical protein
VANRPFDAAAWRQQDAAEYAARENLYDNMAARDAERHKAGHEMTDARKERPSEEIGDAAAERSAQRAMRANGIEAEIEQRAQDQSLDRGGGMGR